MNERKLANEGLDRFDRLFREISLHYHGIQADLFLTTSLYYVSRLLWNLRLRRCWSIYVEWTDDLK